MHGEVVAHGSENPRFLALHRPMHVQSLAGSEKATPDRALMTCVRMLLALLLLA